MEKKLFTIIIYTENIAGMLNQVTAEFTRRMMNIDTITASSSSVEGVHRYTISLWGEEDSVQKVTKRIAKKVDVLKADYYTDSEIFFQEVALYKLSTPKMLEKSSISRIIRHNNARVIEVNANYSVVEVTGQTDTIMALYDEFVAQDCVLQFVKSGRVAVPRASQAALGELLFDEDYKRKAVK
ncbi:MAG: acetolactate synthase small subunit [Bacteroidaceae bacterium]|nr:acetolactate synthase small subunit [Bacteroidaceae bacterium]